MNKKNKQPEEQGFGVVELDDQDLAAVMGGQLEEIDDINFSCPTNSGNCVAGCACPPPK